MHLRMKDFLCLLCMFFILNSAVFAENNQPWRLMGPGDADQVTSLAVLKNGSIWAGNDVGGIYRSQDRGASWNPMNEGLDNLDVSTPIIEDPKIPGKLYVGTRGGIYISSDGGINWALSSKGMPVAKRFQLNHSIGGLAIDGQGTLYVGLGYRPSHAGTTAVRRLNWSNKIYKSSDRGNTWNAQLAFPVASKVYQLITSHTQGGWVYAATSSGLYISKDFGLSWANVFTKVVHNILLLESDPQYIMVAAGKDGVFESSDRGRTWKEKNNGLSFFHYLKDREIRYSTLVRDPVKKSRIFLLNSTWGASGGVYRSENNGDKWKRISGNMPESWLKTSRRMNAIAIEPGSKNGVFVGSSRYMYRSDNHGENWNQLISKKGADGWSHTGFNVFGQTRKVLVDVEDKEMMFIATADHKMVKSTDNGASWRPIASEHKQASHVYDMAICPVGKLEMYAVVARFGQDICILKSRDKGEHWDKRCGGWGKSSAYEKLVVDPEGCKYHYLGTDKGLFISRDGGKSWDKAGGSLPHAKIYDITISELGSKGVFIATEKGLYRSEDKGLSWQKLSTGIYGPITSVAVSRNEPGLWMIGSMTSKSGLAAIYRSYNGGRSWSKVNQGINKYVTAIVQLPAKNTTWYASTMDHNYHDKSKGAGIFRSSDNGKSWKRVDQGLPVFRAYNITTSALHPSKVYLATAGSGAYEMVDPDFR